MILKNQYVAETPKSVANTFELVRSQHSNVEALRMFDPEISEQLMTLRALGDSDFDRYHAIAFAMSCKVIKAARHAREGTNLIPNTKVCFVYVDRAARVMAESAREMYPGSTCLCVDMKRDHDGVAHLLRNDITEAIAQFELVYVIDPMLATAGTAHDTIELFADLPNKSITYESAGNWMSIGNISFAGIVGCPEGIRRLQSRHPIPITLAGIDERLNDVFYILAHAEEISSKQFQRIFKDIRGFDLIKVWEKAKDDKERHDLIMVGDFGDNYLGLRDVITSA